MLKQLAGRMKYYIRIAMCTAAYRRGICIGPAKVERAGTIQIYILELCLARLCAEAKAINNTILTRSLKEQPGVNLSFL